LSDRIESWIIASEDSGIRLDQFIVRRIPDESRSQVQNWIRKGYILTNGEQVKTGYQTRINDHIILRIPELLPNQPFPEDIPLNIIYEDSHLAVLDKPAGLVCHVGAGIRSGTLVNALLHRMGPLVAGDPGRPGIVHRLDKFTSGIMMVAKNNLAHRQLAQQFKNRQVKKEYVALVHGVPSPSSGTISMPIGRDPKNRKRMSPNAHRTRTAITHYDLEENCGCVSLLKIRIETGRTHQIRVHLAQKGHPIVGDSLYGGDRMKNLPVNLLNAAKELGRPFLHSRHLEFHHPQSGERISFSSPLSLELQHFLSIVRNCKASNAHGRSS
jgi:23S rRNA pseudouridine1911/1915/1917 synthase